MEPTSTVDGVSPPAPAVTAPQPAAAPASSTQWKLLIALILGVPYVLYAFWCLFLLTSLPSATASDTFVTIALSSVIAGGIVLAAVSYIIFMRIGSSKALPNAKLIALIKLGLFAVPGILLSAATGFMISGEPQLSIAITNPTSSDQLVAPLTMTFSVAQTVELLKQRGFAPIQYSWDINGDNQIDQQTLSPELTATFDREGIKTVRVVMRSSDGSTRDASRRFLISRSVFSVTPLPAIVERPVVFSLAQLYPQSDAVRTVSWDFDGDGTADDEGPGLQTSFTYLRTGSFTVSAVASLANNTQVRYERTIDVQEEPPQPFPVSMKSQPNNLIGTAPFAALFSIETSEPVHSVQWDFGDGQKGEGQRVTHTFGRNGSYAVVARVRSQSGVIAEVNTLVKVVDELRLNDLRFEGSPQVQSNRISGEVPLTLDLRPVTQTPFVDFVWEAPDATEIGSTDTRLQAIYRRPGTYTITLVGQDQENHVLRLPIEVQVNPPSSVITFQMSPESGIAPLTVKFDASASEIPGEEITGFIWDFRDGSEVEYGGAFSQHVFTRPGTYAVNLTARTTSGKQQSTTRTLVVRAASLQPRILASRLSGQAPLTVAFDASPSSGLISNYEWNFGDNTQNDGMQVEHTFLDPGTYTVVLTVRDAAGASSSTTATITVQ